MSGSRRSGKGSTGYRPEEDGAVRVGGVSLGEGHKSGFPGESGFIERPELQTQGDV